MSFDQHPWLPFASLHEVLLDEGNLCRIQVMERIQGHDGDSHPNAEATEDVDEVLFAGDSCFCLGCRDWSRRSLDVDLNVTLIQFESVLTRSDGVVKLTRICTTESATVFLCLRMD